MSAVTEQIEAHLRTVEALRNEAPRLEAIAAAIVSALAAGRCIYTLGNGGSAADAQHIAAELVGRFKHPQRRALPAVALTTDTSNLTAIGNDFGFEEVFRRQVQALVRTGDVVWALSVSGRSPNVLLAATAAREQGAVVIGFTGTRGGALADLCDHCLVAAHADSDRVQEAHQLAYHIICGLVEQAFVKEPS